MDGGQSALTQLKAYLAQRHLPDNSRLPPERELCDLLGVPRGELRKALATLESAGDLWRHVGKGTFIGTRPVEELSTIAAVAGQTNPSEVMRARLLIEPLLTGEAALQATTEDIEEMHRCLSGARRAESWRQYENWDNRLHRAVAEAARNVVLLSLFDSLNAIRRTVVWGRLRDQPAQPPTDHHSFGDHEAIVAAIEERDVEEATRAMRRHLTKVEQRLLLRREAAE
ncbi:probable transcriptional regulator, GntR family protein [alpha proteobacterium BAL199]|jgi:DNA-binding FadR family transcriptional regulator|nr:probable transcriptional regulator, GntR family protein [alpha proteobacterium BAL199]